MSLVVPTLANIHCPTCLTETLHRGELCVHCGTPYVRSVWYDQDQESTTQKDIRRLTLSNERKRKFRARQKARLSAFLEGTKHGQEPR